MKRKLIILLLLSVFMVVACESESTDDDVFSGDSKNFLWSSVARAHLSRKSALRYCEDADDLFWAIDFGSGSVSKTFVFDEGHFWSPDSEISLRCIHAK